MLESEHTFMWKPNFVDNIITEILVANKTEARQWTCAEILSKWCWDESITV